MRIDHLPGRLTDSMPTDPTLFVPPDPVIRPPEYRAPSRSAAKAADHALLIDAGVHPLTRSHLGPAGETCGTCKHAVRYRRFVKCAVDDTRSEASDIRLKWPACPRWSPVA